MPLSEYHGRTPRGYESDVTIGRVRSHRIWKVTANSDADCANCGSTVDGELPHLVVTLTRGTYRDEERRYLCNERCVREWVEDGDGASE
ncbi:MAG: DUF7576 family protein [Halobacteriota archaeon]